MPGWVGFGWLQVAARRHVDHRQFVIYGAEAIPRIKYDIARQINRGDRRVRELLVGSG